MAILDTGVDGSQPDLAGQLVAGTSFVGGSATTDPNGHGTAMAGIVAAATDNGIGIAGVGFDGVSIMPVSVLGADGTGRDSDIIEGLVWAADHGADVALMAFSAPSYSARPAVGGRLRLGQRHGSRRGDRQRRLVSRRRSRPAIVASSACPTRIGRCAARVVQLRRGNVPRRAWDIDRHLAAGGGTTTVTGTSASAAHRRCGRCAPARRGRRLPRTA